MVTEPRSPGLVGVEKGDTAKAPAFVRMLAKRIATSDAPAFEIELADGVVHRLASEQAAAAEPAFRISIRSKRGLKALTSLQENAIAVAYMEGDLDVSGDFAQAMALRDSFSDFHPLLSVWRFLRPMLGGQVKADNEWVPQHYDHGNEFYFTFLDNEVGLYSQALYKADDETLEQAVVNKLDYILDVCRLEKGSHVLDVGAGWGAFERYAGRRGIDSTMLTLSHEQRAFLEEFASSHDMPATLDVKYANIYEYLGPPSEDGSPECYDAVVLLGVMEHLPDYERLFRQFEKLVRPGGFVYMDFAANRTKFKVRSFTYQYVFPGNHTPVVIPDLLAAANKTAFEPIAVHNDRHSYYLTLCAWGRRLEAARERLGREFGEKVFRLFQMYLWGCAHQMRSTGTLESFRVVLQKSAGTDSANVGVYRGI